MSHECQRLLELLHDFVSGELNAADLEVVMMRDALAPHFEEAA